MSALPHLLPLLPLVLGLAGPAPAQTLVKDIWKGASSSSPRELTVATDRMFFVATDGSGGAALYKTDGTSKGTVKVVAFAVGPSYVPRQLTAAGNDVFFVRNDPEAATPHGLELWKSDGTAAGTVLVRDIRPGKAGSSPANLTGAGDKLLFSADDGANGRELWKSDGTAAGTVLVRDIMTGSLGSDPKELTPLASGFVLFAAANKGLGREPWTSNGARLSTNAVKNIHETGSSLPWSFAKLGSYVYFGAWDLKHGGELWRSTGTSAATQLVKDIRTGTDPSFPDRMTAASTKLYFWANDGTHGTELFVHDYDSFTTTLAKDLRPGAASSPPSDFTAIGTRVVFPYWSSAAGLELWTSDGTAAGTKLVKDTRAGNGSSLQFGALPVATGTRFAWFAADDGTSGRELWKSDGTKGGTKLVSDLNGGAGSSNPMHLTLFDGKLYFQADDGKTGAELWVVDPDATSKVLDPGCGPRDRTPSMRAADAVLGKSMRVDGRDARRGAVGVLLLGGRARTPLSLGGGCVSQVDLGGFFFVLHTFVATAGTWSVDVPIPADPSLAGIRVALQTWFLSLTGGKGLELTNGMLVGLGK